MGPMVLKQQIRVAAAVLLLTATAVRAPRGEDPGLWDSAERAACDAVIDATSNLDRVEAGGEVRLTITAAAGGCELSSVVLTDSLPFVVDADGRAFPAFTVVAADHPATSSGESEIVWELGTIPAGGSASVTLTVTFDEPLAADRAIVNAACLAAAELEGSRCDNAVVAVGAAGGPEPNGTPGFWCRQILGSAEEGPPGDIPPVELIAVLNEANNASLVFTALYDTSSVALTAPLLCRPETLAGTPDRLARKLVALWWNVASRRVSERWRLGELCPGGEDPPEGTEAWWTIGAVLDESESALLYGAPDRALHFWSEVIDFANQAHPPGPCSQPAQRRRGPAAGEP